MAEDTAALVETVREHLGNVDLSGWDSYERMEWRREGDSAINALARELARQEHVVADLMTMLEASRQVMQGASTELTKMQARATRAEEALREAEELLAEFATGDLAFGVMVRDARRYGFQRAALTPTEEPRCPTCDETWRYRMGMAYRTDLCTDDFHLRPTEEPEHGPT